MTTSILDRVPADRIARRAAAARPGRTLLALVTGVLFALGFAAARVLAVAWLAVAWCGAAVTEGWLAARDGEAARRAGIRAGRS